MRELLESILNKQYEKANSLFEERVANISTQKLHEVKKIVAAKISEEAESFESALDEDVEVSRELDEQQVNTAGKSDSPVTTVTKNNAGKSPEDSLIDRNTQALKKQQARGQIPPGNTNYNSDYKLEEAEELDEARIKIIKARVRGGKVQRRKKISNVEGYTLRGGKMKRMTPMERRRRKLGQKRGKLKRRAKLRMALMKRKRSMRKRTSIGLR